jgi:hypothetical protein
LFFMVFSPTSVSAPEMMGPVCGKAVVMCYNGGQLCYHRPPVCGAFISVDKQRILEYVKEYTWKIWLVLWIGRPCHRL